MPHMLFADFATRPAAERALDQLEEVGYRHDELRFITRASDPEELALLRQTMPVDSTFQSLATGAVCGGIIGLAAAAILSNSAPTVLTGNPVATALGLSGLTAMLMSGFVTGLVVGAVIALLGRVARPADDSRHFDEVLAQGGAVVGVPVSPADEPTVRDILSDCQQGLLDAGWYGESAESYFSASEASAARTDSARNSSSDSRIRSSHIP